MSRKGVEKSSAGQESSAHSVYDFLYYDARRIGSFIAQFDPAGHLQGHTLHTSTGSTTGSKFQTEANGGVPGFAKGRMAGEESADRAEGKSSEKRYDPLWSNALNFLDMLAARELINRTVEGTRIGQFVLVSGNLQVVDLTLVRDMWALPSVSAAVAAGAESQSQPDTRNRKERRANRQPSKSDSPPEHQVGMDILKIIPHSVQATVTAESTPVWSSLKEDGLIVSGSDLFLKHGRHIPGQWHMLGILDGLPSDEQNEVPTAEDAALGILGGLGFVLDMIGPFARILLGRPSSAYSVTPLLIFRAVEAQ